MHVCGGRVLGDVAERFLRAAVEKRLELGAEDEVLRDVDARFDSADPERCDEIA